MILCGVTAVLTAFFCSTPLDTLVNAFIHSGRDARYVREYAQLASGIAATGAEHSESWSEASGAMPSNYFLKVLEWLTKYEGWACGYASLTIYYLNHF